MTIDESRIELWKWIDSYFSSYPLDAICRSRAKLGIHEDLSSFEQAIRADERTLICSIAGHECTELDANAALENFAKAMRGPNETP